MSQKHHPKNPIKPPLHLLQPSDGVPPLPTIDPAEAVALLTRKEWSERHVVGRRITCLRQIIASLVGMDALPADFDQVVFDRVVIEQADLSELEIPFSLYFQEVFFLDGLNLNSSRFTRLDISGYVGYGLSLVETEGKPVVNLANLQADQVYIYGGAGIDHLDVSDSIIGTLTVASIVIDRSIFLRNSAIAPDGLWFEAVSVGGEIRLLNSSVQKLFRIHDVSCAGSIELQTSNLDAPLSTRNSVCTRLGLSESKCVGRLDFRHLSFQELDVSNTLVPGQLILSLEQLQRDRQASGAIFRIPLKWDTPPRLTQQRSATLGEVVTVAEQLIVLRENFRRIPIAETQERYCVYQLADSTWQVCGWGPLNRLLRWIVRHWFGYLLFPSRVVRTMILAILFFAGLFIVLPTFGIGGLSFPDGTSILKDGVVLYVGRCLYFSILTFCTSVYGDIHPVGVIKAVAATEAFTGLIVVALFVVSLARRLFRW